MHYFEYFTMNELDALELKYKNDHTVLNLIYIAKLQLAQQTEEED